MARKADPYATQTNYTKSLISRETSSNNRNILGMISSCFCCFRQNHKYEPIMNIDPTQSKLKESSQFAQQAQVHTSENKETTSTGTSAGQDDVGIFELDLWEKNAAVETSSDSGLESENIDPNIEVFDAVKPETSNDDAKSELTDQETKFNTTPITITPPTPTCNNNW